MMDFVRKCKCLAGTKRRRSQEDQEELTPVERDEDRHMKQALLWMGSEGRDAEDRKQVRERYCQLKEGEESLKGLVERALLGEKGVLRIKVFTHSANKEISPKVYEALKE